MIRNHIYFAVKNLLHTKAFSLINIGGLVISMAAFILMALYIENELDFDTFNTKADRIYRVVEDKETNALKQHSAGSAAPVAPALNQDFPQIKEAVRLIDAEGLVKAGDKLAEERGIFFADASFFKVFDMPLLTGDAARALVAPMSVVLTKTTAVKYLGKTDVVGRSLTIDGTLMNITGVMDDVPANSHITFNILISMATAQQKGSGYDWLFTNWYSNNFWTYVLLDDANDAPALAGQLEAFAERYGANTLNTKHHYSLEKLTDIYLRSDRENQVGKTGNSTNLTIFCIVALFILVIACINFINLSTARSAQRAKEIAIKKVNGVSRMQLTAQFYIESFLMAGSAIIIAAIVAWLLIPGFNAFAGKSISQHLFSGTHLLYLAIILLIVGIFSGSYPAFILSGFDPITALKGTVRSSAWSIAIRKGLVVFQFVISITLIISSLVVYTQLRFMQRHDLGFTLSQTMVINFEGDPHVQQHYQLIRERLLQINGVKQVAASSKVPGMRDGGGWSMDVVRKTGDTIHTEMPIFLTDFNFMKLYQVPMVAGRALSPLFAADTVESMIINETALRKLGFSRAEEAIGVKVGMYPNDARIIGVYHDFHFESLQKRIDPLAMRIMPDKFRMFSVQLNTSNLQQTVAAIEDLWKNVAPQRPLEYTFLDETFNRQYESEVKFAQVFVIFTVLAISIACFGLFGLALFSVKQRTREIGIRKVIGASTAQITLLLSGGFLKLVFIAILIASPIAWYSMSRWIQGFAYQEGISGWIFVLSSVIAVAVALATISFQAIRAALTNPARSLRSD